MGKPSQEIPVKVASWSVGYTWLRWGEKTEGKTATADRVPPSEQWKEWAEGVEGLEGFAELLERRGQVTGLSAKSAMRLGYELGASSLIHCNGLAYSVHLTLTAPADFKRCQKWWQNRWAAWNTYLSRLGLCGVWRLEFQARGAPHWHVLLFVPVAETACGEEAELLFTKAADHWRKVTGNPEHAAVYQSEANQRAAFYLALHSAKKTEAQGVWPAWWKGRAWGHVNRPAWDPWQKVLGSESVAEDGRHYRRFCRRFIWRSQWAMYRRRLEHWQKTGKGSQPRKPRRGKYAPQGVYVGRQGQAQVLAWVGSMSGRVIDPPGVFPWSAGSYLETFAPRRVWSLSEL